MLIMAALLIIALLCNITVRPVAGRYFSTAQPSKSATPSPLPVTQAQASQATSTAEKSAAYPARGKLIVCWLIVGIPLAWGIWKTLTKLPALFQ